jgi:menaquinone-dependent protoporphyrinogen IX oxidase
MTHNIILVTYALRTGSTAGVAEAIGKILSESGTRVDVQPMLALALELNLIKSANT